MGSFPEKVEATGWLGCVGSPHDMQLSGTNFVRKRGQLLRLGSAHARVNRPVDFCQGLLPPWALLIPCSSPDRPPSSLW